MVIPAALETHLGMPVRSSRRFHPSLCSSKGELLHVSEMPLHDSRLIIIHALYCAEKILIDFIIFYFFQTNTVFGQFVHEFFAADQVNLLFAGI